MKILAVDDEPFILELLPMLAAKSGFPDVTTAHSGDLALETLVQASAPFDCLLLDINMPGMDGIELCSRVRQLDRYEKTPILMLTAMSERDHIDRAFKAGATDYATKPFDINELGARLRMVQNLLTARREAELAKTSYAASGASANRIHDFDLSEPILVDGIRDIVDFTAFKNYLKQTSSAGLAASQLIAVKIDGIEDIYARATGDEFPYVLRETAHAISEVVRRTGGLITYTGQGIFGVVSNSAAQLVAADMESEVQFFLDERNLAYDSGVPLDIEVSIGNSIQPTSGDDLDAPKSIDRAIARAEARSKTKHDGPPSINIRRHEP